MFEIRRYSLLSSEAMVKGPRGLVCRLPTGSYRSRFDLDGEGYSIELEGRAGSRRFHLRNRRGRSLASAARNHWLDRSVQVRLGNVDSELEERADGSIVLVTNSGERGLIWEHAEGIVRAEHLEWLSPPLAVFVLWLALRVMGSPLGEPLLPAILQFLVRLLTGAWGRL